MDSPRPEEGLDRGQCYSVAWPPTLPTALASLLAGFRLTTNFYGCGDVAVATGSYRRSLDKNAGPEASVASSPGHRKTSDYYSCWHPSLLSIPDSRNPHSQL